MVSDYIWGPSISKRYIFDIGVLSDLYTFKSSLMLSPSSDEPSPGVYVDSIWFSSDYRSYGMPCYNYCDFFIMPVYIIYLSIYLSTQILIVSNHSLYLETIPRYFDSSKQRIVLFPQLLFDLRLFFRSLHTILGPLNRTKCQNHLILYAACPIPGLCQNFRDFSEFIESEMIIRVESSQL